MDGVSTEGKEEGYVFRLDSLVVWLKHESFPNTLLIGCDETAGGNSPHQTFPAGQAQPISHCITPTFLEGGGVILSQT